jgi:cation diffusion facilitator family transporter
MEESMHTHQLEKWQHSHRYEFDYGHGERNTRRVIALTLFMMVIEIGAGMMFGSMALLADGWHMGTHAIALGITAFAYAFARKHADNPDYSFGTGKVGVLGGFTSAVVLAVIALIMAAESVQRLFEPRPIRFNEAIGVAVVGLLVNLISAYLLMDRHHRHRGHSGSDAHDSPHHHPDHNLRAAYLHVITDALTSVLAIIALFAGKLLGWTWMDPVMGIVGAVIILKWARGLLQDTGKILLDRDVAQETISEIRSVVEADSDNRVADIHLWRAGPKHLYAILSIVTHFPKPPSHYKNLLTGFEDLIHVTVEVNPCESGPCIMPGNQPETPVA